MAFSEIDRIYVRYAEDIGQGIQFGMVQFGQLGQAALARRKQVDIDLATVDLAAATFDQFEFFTARYQRNYAVVLRLQALGQLADAGPVAAESTFYMQQQQILLRRNSFALGGLFTKTQEFPELIAECR